MPLSEIYFRVPNAEPQATSRDHGTRVDLQALRAELENQYNIGEYSNLDSRTRFEQSQLTAHGNVDLLAAGQI